MWSQMAQVDYRAILDEAWQQHLVPKSPDAPTLISLFAGCGGSSLGYSMAGYRELLAVEWNDNAVATFKLNFPDVPVYHGDICKLTVKQVLKRTSLEPGELDLLDGSPPCQGFSTAGKRQLDDPRNSLAMEFVRLLRGLRPKVFVMENVSGLVKGKMKLVFAEIMRELKVSGYNVKCRLMNAMYFQVPQSRQRLIWIGIRNSFEIEPKFLKPKSRLITVKNAFDSIYQGPVVYPDYNTALGQCCLNMKPGQSADQYWKKNWGYQLIRLVWDKVAPTVSKGGGATGHIHPAEPRKVSISELKRLCSFSDQFETVGKRTTVQNRLGNSVPPLFMRAIAGHIRAAVWPELDPILSKSTSQ